MDDTIRNPLVSVIIPTFNRRTLLLEAIKSVQAQTYQNFEVLVIDDGSTDNTKEAVENIDDPKIKYFWQNNTGLPAVARNNGLRKARGEYIAFLDSDDLWLPQKLEKQLKIFSEKKNLLLMATNACYFKDGYCEPAAFLLKDVYLNFRTELVSNRINNSGAVMRSEVIESVGFQDENPDLRTVEDYDYWLRILKYRDDSAYVMKEQMVKLRLHPSQSTIYSKDSNSSYKKVNLILDKYVDYDKSLVEHIRKNLKNIELKLLFYGGIISVKELLSESKVSLFDRFLIYVKFVIRNIIANVAGKYGFARYRK